MSFYNKKQIDFLNQNVRIFSALYGLLSPLDGIKPYRLDMKMISLPMVTVVFKDKNKNGELVSKVSVEKWIEKYESTRKEYDKLLLKIVININHFQL